MSIIYLFIIFLIAEFQSHLFKNHINLEKKRIGNLLIIFQLSEDEFIRGYVIKIGYIHLSKKKKKFNKMSKFLFSSMLKLCPELRVKSQIIQIQSRSLL